MNIENNIIAGAEKLFLKYGVKSVTMDDLARELGISKKTLYQEVENKADLVEKVLKQHILCEKTEMTEIREQSANAIEEIHKIARYVLKMLREMGPAIIYDLKKHYRIIWDELEKFHKQYVYTVIKDNIEWGMEEGLYRENLDADIIAKLYVGKTLAVIDEEVFPLTQYNREQLYIEYMRYHINGIATEKGLEMLKKYE